MKHIKLFEQFINEGIHDPGILKAYFMAGGPGSGKSYVVNTIFGTTDALSSTLSTSTGLKLVSSDKIFELILNRNGYNPKKLADYAEDPATWGKVMQLRNQAKDLLNTRMENYVEGRLGLIIDGTGKNYDTISTAAAELKALGYDIHMIFVNTSEAVAQQRNLQRPRTLAPTMVTKMWHQVQDNIGKFQGLFKKNLFIVDNSDKEQNTIAEAEKQIMRTLRKPVQNPIGKNWLKNNQ